MTTCPFGFRLKGAFVGERRLVDWQAAFAAYAACDPRADLDCESYLSAFTFGEDFRARADSYGVLDTKDFGGACWTPWLPWDIDRAGDLDLALREARCLVLALDQRFKLATEDDMMIFLSGNKGFHVECPTALWNPEPSPDFHRIARQFAARLAERAGVGVYDQKRGYRIDEGVYNKVQPFRAPNSRHPKSGRYKRRLSFDELMHLSADGILRLAEQPEPFDVPAPAYRSEQAAADWQEAIHAVTASAEVKEHRRTTPADGNPCLNRLTLDFIANGAEEGDRHRTFSAAANLAEFGCPSSLAHALLTPAARESGLPPKEIRRQIECGLRYEGSPVEVPPGASAPAPPVPDQERLKSQLAALWAAPVTGAPASPAQAADVPPQVGGEQIQTALGVLWAKALSSPSTGGEGNPAQAGADDPDEQLEREAIQAEGKVREPVTPPPDAPLYFADEARRPCPAAAAVFWTWEGASRWFHVADHPPPTHPTKVTNS